MTIVYALECERCLHLESVGSVSLTGYSYARSWLNPYHAGVSYSHVCTDCHIELDAELDAEARESKAVQA